MSDPIRMLHELDAEPEPQRCNRSASGQEWYRSRFANSRCEAPAAEDSDTCQPHLDMLGWL